MKKGILIISHGSRDTAWVKQVDILVHEAKQLIMQRGQGSSPNEAAYDVPIYACYLELVEGRLIQDGIDYLQNEGVTHIHVVPLFVSEGSSHIDEIKQAFGFTPISDFIGDLEPLRAQAEVIFHGPIVDDPEVVHILHEQIQELSNEPEHEAVLLLGHGSSMAFFYERWERGMQMLVQKLSQYPDIPSIQYASLLPQNAREKLEGLLKQPEVERVLVIPVFISPGYFTNRVIPNALAGLEYVYQGKTLLPHHEMVKLIVRKILNICNA